MVVRLAALWHAVAELLAEDGPAASGRAAVTENGELRLFGAEDIKAEWRRTPTLAIDATADMTLLQLRVPHAELVGEIEAESPHMHVVQYHDRAFGKLAMRNPRLLFKVWDWCVAYASRAGGKWGVVMPLEAETKIRAEREIPNFIQLHHFGGLRGLDDLRDVRGLIAVGRPMAGPGEVERIAGALSGRAVEAVDDWYPAEVVQLHARDGSIASVEADRHPDELAERVRASIAEGELLQTVGRGRGLNRTADRPLEVVLLGNVPVPGLAVDELRRTEAELRSAGRSQRAAVWAEIVETIIAAQDAAPVARS
jgi:putative DNA primase/helicase